MFFFHHGATVQPSAVHVGNKFIARAIVQNKDGATDFAPKPGSIPEQ